MSLVVGISPFETDLVVPENRRNYGLSCTAQLSHELGLGYLSSITTRRFQSHFPKPVIRASNSTREVMRNEYKISRFGGLGVGWRAIP
jgi:hypothetical protein